MDQLLTYHQLQFKIVIVAEYTFLIDVHVVLIVIIECISIDLYSYCNMHVLSSAVQYFPGFITFHKRDFLQKLYMIPVIKKALNDTSYNVFRKG